MFNRAIKSTILLLLVFGMRAYSTPVDLSHIKRSKEANPTTTVSKKETNSIDAFTNMVSAGQITSQTFKPANIVKDVLNTSNNLVISINYLKNIYGSRPRGHIPFRKLILFPFHGFW